MSKVPKRPYSEIAGVAESLLRRVLEASDVAELAGSIKRKAEMIGDIEIIAIPLIDNSLLQTNPSEYGSTKIHQLVSSWERDMKRKGLEFIVDGYGPKTLKFNFTNGKGNRFYIDMYLQTAETWAVNKMIRTGNALFSKKMVTNVSDGGYKPDNVMVHQARVWDRTDPDNPELLVIHSERQLFEVWGMDYTEPERRSIEEW